LTGLVIPVISVSPVGIVSIVGIGINERNLGRSLVHQLQAKEKVLHKKQQGPKELLHMKMTESRLDASALCDAAWVGPSTQGNQSFCWSSCG